MAKKFFEHAGFSIEPFAQIFAAVYDLYYRASQQTDEYAMMLEGDRLLRDAANKPLLAMLAGHRHDIITSDREVAAFAVAYGVCQRCYADGTDANR